MPITRRHFLAAATQSTLLLAARAQAPRALTTRPEIAVLDRDRILAAAHTALARAEAPSPGTRAGFLAFTLDLPALAAALLIDPTQTAAYLAQSTRLLQTWLIDPATRLPANPALTSFEPLADRAALAEIAVALALLPLDAVVASSCATWFTSYLNYLLNSRVALLARDSPDHHGSSWLLQAAAAARIAADSEALSLLRHRVRTPMLRAQIDPSGFFAHELPTPDPYRNSLFNLDLLAGSCVLLSTRFESPWTYELPDGPGMRAAIARHAPYLRNRDTWPYPADQTLFRLLPCRRPALLFAARAFQQPDYATLWQALEPAQPTDPDLLYTFPIRQPLLWTRQPTLLG